ncbi:MAG: hypothetical protein ACYDA4_03160 [Ignavibacteriaceae bacterium]
MNTRNNKPLMVAFIVVVVLFLFFSVWGMSGGMMSGGMNSGMNGNGWMGWRSWMWAPTLITLFLGVALGWAIFKKKE